MGCSASAVPSTDTAQSAELSSRRPVRPPRRSFSDLAEAADPLDEKLSLRFAQDVRICRSTFDDSVTQSTVARFALSGSGDGGEDAFTDAC